MARDFLVVKADNGNIFRNSQTRFLERFVAANRGTVVLAEDGGRSILQRQQFPGCLISCTCRPVTFNYQLRFEWDVGSSQCPTIAFQPVLRRLHPRLASNHSDTTMAMLDQMPG